MDKQVKNILLNLHYRNIALLIFFLFQNISNGVSADSFCDSELNVESFERSVTNCIEFKSVGHLLVQGRGFFETDLDYISFSSAHYFGQDTKGTYYATTSAHVIDKFKYFQEKSPGLVLYLSFGTPSKDTLLTVIESSCHQKYLNEQDTPYQYDIALLKLKFLNDSGHRIPAPTPLDLREIPVPEDTLPLYAVGFGPKGWVGGTLCQYNGNRHAICVYLSKFMTQEFSKDVEFFKNSWLSPLSYHIEEYVISLRSLKHLEGGLNHGMSGSTCFREDNGKAYAVAISTASIKHSMIPVVGESDLSLEEEGNRLIYARLTGNSVPGLNPKKGQVDIVVPYHVMKDFFIKQMKEWGVTEEELQKFFIFS